MSYNTGPGRCYGGVSYDTDSGRGYGVRSVRKVDKHCDRRTSIYTKRQFPVEAP